MSQNPTDLIANSPMSATQIMAVCMCIMLTALDGFDVLAISFASPGISSEWGINRAALGVVLSMELIGMAVGSILLGNFADKYGRRPTILICLVVMSAGMLAAGLAKGINDLSAYRFITGLGIGGMLASTSAMAAEFSSAKHRSMAVILMAAGYPLGAVLGGAVASELLKYHDWRAVFYFGATATALFILLVWYILPESISYLIHKRPQGALEQINKILLRMKHSSIPILPDVEPSAKSAANSGMGALFSAQLSSTTLLLTAAYFTHIMTFYFILKWIPKIVVDMGYAPSAAGGVLVWANVGGLLGCMLLGLLSHRFAVRILVIIMLAGGATMVAVFGQGQQDLQQLALIAGVAGFFTNAAVVGLYALFTLAFPTELRASGTGFVIGIGRGGAALGPITAGLMFSAGYGLQSVSFAMAIGSLLAILALFFLRTRRNGG
ncbi:MAG: benzoate transport [Paraglaciecola sp.]|jgi:benzoate transport